MDLLEDKKSAIAFTSATDLSLLKVLDAFYQLRKTHPLDLKNTNLHGPRKYNIGGRKRDWNDNMLETAFNMVFLETERKLNTLKSRCDVKKNILPHNLFSWTIQDSIDRLQLTDSLYIDLIALNNESDVLDRIKLQLDLTQVLEIFNKIADDFMAGTDLGEEIIPTLEEYVKHDKCQKELNVLFHNNTVQYRSFVETYNRNLLFPPAKLKEELLPRQQKLQVLNMESDALIPIQDRYTVNWYKTNTYFKKFKNSKFLQITKDKIHELNSLFNSEDDALHYKLSMYNIQRTNYMDSFDNFTEQYDIDYEIADNDNGILKAKLNKAIEDLKHYKEQVEFFKMAVVKTREKIRLEELEKLELERKSEAPPVKKAKGKPKKPKKK